MSALYLFRFLSRMAALSSTAALLEKGQLVPVRARGLIFTKTEAKSYKADDKKLLATARHRELVVQQLEQLEKVEAA